jgi:D-serine deaminase-like pyridoxal phosphate-dependent protein
VLSTVVSRNRSRNTVIIDAGGLALSKDRSTQATARDLGFGIVLDEAGEATLGDLTISAVHQEHGEIRDVPLDQFERLQIGSRVRVVPNHVCMTAAMYDSLHVVDGSRQDVVATWERTNGWELKNS